VCLPVQAARIYTHHRHLLLLLSPKADTNGMTLKTGLQVVQVHSNKHGAIR